MVSPTLCWSAAKTSTAPTMPFHIRAISNNCMKGLKRLRITESLKSRSTFDQLLHYARVLSADFPFVRADFYEVDGQVYFAELTFTPDCNYLSHYNMEFQRRLGAKLILPEKYK